VRSIEFPLVSSLSLTVCFIPYIQQTIWLCCSSALGILCFVCSRIKYFRRAVLNAACCCKCRSSVGLYGLCSSWVHGCAAQKRLNRRQTHVDPRKHVLDWGGSRFSHGKEHFRWQTYTRQSAPLAWRTSWLSFWTWRHRYSTPRGVTQQRCGLLPHYRTLYSCLAFMTCVLLCIIMQRGVYHERHSSDCSRASVLPAVAKSLPRRRVRQRSTHRPT